MTAPKIRTVFMGTPSFSVPALQALLGDPRFDVLGVLTQPDRPSGRGQKRQPSPVKQTAEQSALTIWQPVSLRKDTECLAWIRSVTPDVFVTIAFGQILSQEVLDIPRLGTVNVHASLLPRWRGANPIQWAIKSGDATTGLTTMLTDIGVDTGAMLLRWETPIQPEDRGDSLAHRLAQAAGPLLIDTLVGLSAGTVSPQPQDASLATHAPKAKKEEALLDWQQPATILAQIIRAQQPWPGAVLPWSDATQIKILSAVALSPEQQETLASLKQPTLPKSPGEILGVLKTTDIAGVCVQTGDGIILLREVQPPGKKAMPALDWFRGLNTGHEILR
ncbi:MAG: methionyl-tRNA formyltransferase [Cyanobacteria bacterium]|nr:methionyl-tRNA formyltransferase [Cyanobacteriota bacterium]